LFSTLASLLRMAHVGFVLAREGALALVDPAAIPPGPAAWGIKIARLIERRDAGSSAKRLAAALTRLGPSHVKFGQFLATRPDLVGMKAAADLSQLQDRMPAFPKATAEKTVEAALGRPVSEVFQAFEEPVAAASIAQVHPALTKDGRKVAVKVLRPKVRERFAKDLNAMRRTAELAESLSPQARRLRFTEVVDTLIRSVAMEMDLRTGREHQG
jgi:ubiquinone biosynthesis protein